LAVGQDGQNKKELEDALSALSVEEQELKKREEEFKVKEKVLTLTFNIFYTFVFFYWNISFDWRIYLLSST